MAYLETCLGMVAPYYNLALVIVVILLFLKLFSIKTKRIYILPWKILFFALLVYVFEEIVTVLAMSKIIVVFPLMFPVLEMVIITSFIYMLLLQKEYVKK